MESMTPDQFSSAMKTMEEFTKGMTFKQKAELFKAIRQGRVKMLTKEEIDEMNAKSVNASNLVPLQKQKGTNITPPAKKHRNNRSASKSRAKNRKK